MTYRGDTPPDSRSPAGPPVDRRPRVVVSWSTGKDAAFALERAIADGRSDIVGLLTTVTPRFGRVSIHGVRESLLRQQARSLGLPLFRVPLPYPCPNHVYARRMSAACRGLVAAGVTGIIFGDLFLEDVRAYRERQLSSTGLTPLFPLWGNDTRQLAHRMLDAGIRARLVCVDPARMPPAFAGRPFDDALLDDLPDDVDPCGENGEFHTFVTSAPSFRAALRVRPGRSVARDGAVYADLIPDGAALTRGARRRRGLRRSPSAPSSSGNPLKRRSPSR